MCNRICLSANLSSVKRPEVKSRQDASLNAPTVKSIISFPRLRVQIQEVSRQWWVWIRGWAGNIRERRWLGRNVELEAAHEITKRLTLSPRGHPDYSGRFPAELEPALQRAQTGRRQIYQEHYTVDGATESDPVKYIQESENTRTRKQIPQSQGQAS